MATHPEVQKKAQTEIDLVIGSDRLPEFEDRPSLPYLEAIYREVMRWNQSLPLAAPHALTEDDYYKGYFIPKGAFYTLYFMNCLLTYFLQTGTTVFGNVWSVYIC